MPGFMPGIHVFVLDIPGKQDVDGRDEPGHDGGGFLTDRAYYIPSNSRTDVGHFARSVP